MTHKEADGDGNIECDVCGVFAEEGKCIRYADGYVYCSEKCVHNHDLHSEEASLESESE